ncbi:MAG: ribonuclease Z [Candidatus Micrarchaeia archaeon]
MAIKITFLGTSGATPTKSRGLPSVALEYDKDLILFDCGEGTQRQMLKYGVNLSKISYIFISHIHGDHIFGIPGLIRSLALNGRSRDLQIFVPSESVEKFKKLLYFDKQILSYPIKIISVRQGRQVKTSGFEIHAFKLSHSVENYGYIFMEKDHRNFIVEKCRNLGIEGTEFSELSKRSRIEKGGKIIRISAVTKITKGKKIAYVADTRPLASTVAHVKNADLLVHEASYDESMKHLAAERMHSTAREAAEVASKAHAKRLVLFHISARYKTSRKLENEARKVFINTSFAYDGMEINL